MERKGRQRRVHRRSLSALEPRPRSLCLRCFLRDQANSSRVVSYLLTDGEGSTRALTNSSGAVTATFNYDTEGNLLGVTYMPTSPPPTVYLYDQQQLDVAVGQYQLRARIYNPATGEFDEYDPMTHTPGDLLGANPYIYANDDAPNMDDPNGTSAISNALFEKRKGVRNLCFV